jgi:superfamily I DNA/RNA helicase
MALEPTPEQQLILAEARSKDSLLINALAGAAKTTTLVMLASRLPMEPTLCLAFNKRIAEEMAKRMPSHILCATLNSAGHRAWGQSIGKKLRVETDKLYTIVSDVNGRLPADERREAGETFAATLRALRLAKSAGYVPRGMRKFGTTLCELHELMESFARQVDVNPSDWFLNRLDAMLETSIAQAYEGLIDFDDQIYMSTLFGGTYPRYPIVLVDEAQDLSPLNHASLKKLFGGRLIAVGDPHQAIYAFRGASHTSMAELKTAFEMKELTLSTSFRCPINVIKNVHWHVPRMAWPDWASVGTVEHLAEWGPSDIPDGAAIICRNNAPIFRTALSLIRARRGVKILGNDIGASLVKTLEKLGPGSLNQTEVLAAIEVWRVAQEKKAHEARIASIRDKAECLRVFAEYGATLDESVAYAKHLFAASGPIEMMTGHKAKGGEWDIVFHLDPFLVPSKWAQIAAEEGDEAQLIQEKNLKYVIDTRAKQSLYYVNSEDFQS